MNRPVLVTGCYIVKDEERVLAASLEAIRPFVDEVVVYDTGSSDRTVDIARAAGATVIQGYWDDDFGAARNRALADCHGDWVIAVDADEVARGDVQEFRRLLLRAVREDVITVDQVSTAWDSPGEDALVVRVARIFRRRSCHWVGALHEQIRARSDKPLTSAHCALRLMHSGYSVVTSKEKGKPERNLAVARRELAKAEANDQQDLAPLWGSTWRGRPCRRRNRARRSPLCRPSTRGTPIRTRPGNESPWPRSPRTAR